jgi:hypothetical protein
VADLDQHHFFRFGSNRIESELRSTLFTSYEL